MRGYPGGVGCLRKALWIRELRQVCAQLPQLVSPQQLPAVAPRLPDGLSVNRDSDLLASIPQIHLCLFTNGISLDLVNVKRPAPDRRSISECDSSRRVQLRQGREQSASRRKTSWTPISRATSLILMPISCDTTLLIKTNVRRRPGGWPNRAGKSPCDGPSGVCRDPRPQSGGRLQGTLNVGLGRVLQVRRSAAGRPTPSSFRPDCWRRVVGRRD